MNLEEAQLFDIVESQLSNTYAEIGILSKKKPDGPINKFKITLINQQLRKINSLLGEKYIPFEGFEVFEDENLPSASDVVFVLSQYLQSMDRMRFDNIEQVGAGIRAEFYWKIDKKGRGPETRGSSLSKKFSSLL